MIAMKNKKGKNKITFTAMTTVYGGTDGVKLFLKNQIMESVYRFEDSGLEIVSMEIQNLYINKKSAIKIIVLEKPRCMEQYLIILGIWQMLVIIMVVVFLNSYLVHYTTQMKNPRKRIAK